MLRTTSGFKTRKLISIGKSSVKEVSGDNVVNKVDVVDKINTRASEPLISFSITRARLVLVKWRQADSTAPTLYHFD